ncbi:hypothetical protein TRSC58_04709 [Trypanosoma rangeli SC58]|uniref:Uncharacterized protein n=1 Tax=Trypanosoma rangeli SC58 TaxID=429131 RepID=A0A061IY69_TRYRA|nr:hypothetical protein TRSC58_04709 [Trypanosoma rangeli SC58]
MFRGLLGGAGRQWCSERRLATVMKATSRNPAQRSTYRICRTHLEKQSAMRIKGDAKCNQNHAMTPPLGCSDLSYADVEFLRSQQDEALAEHDARVRASARDAGIAQRHRSCSVSPQYLRYNSVDSTSGNSIIQERFDALVHDAVLKYGPPLPAEFVSENDVVTALGSRDNSAASSSKEDPGVCHFYDEVELRPQELFSIIRRLDPLFSVRTHADSVPFSLLIKNCPYLKVWGGKVHFMRCLRRLSLRPTGDGEGDEVTRGEVTMTLSKYKMREPPSFDGLRQGPQPWIYNYRMM